MNKHTYRVREIADVVGGGTPKTSEDSYWGDDISWITPNDLADNESVFIGQGNKSITKLGYKKSGAKMLPTGTLLFSSRAPIGYIAIAKNELCTNQGFKSLVFKTNVHNLYMYYWFKCNLEYLKLYGSGATFPEISASRMNNIKLEIFSDKQYQVTIAEVLFKYDSLIENNCKKITLLEDIMKKSYRHIFSNSKDSFWDNCRLKDFIRFTRGHSYSSCDIEDGDNVLLSMNNVRAWGGYIRDNSRCYSGKYNKDQLLKKGDLIMSITDMTQDRRIIGYVGIFDDSNEKCVIGTHLMKLESTYNNLFLYGLFNFSGLSRYISEFSTGANVLGLTENILKKIKVKLPPQNLIDKYLKLVTPIYNEIVNSKNQIDNLVRQRDALLPRLMSGKLEVR